MRLYFHFLRLGSARDGDGRITGRQDVGEPYPPRNTSKISFATMVLPDRRGGIAVAAPSLHVRF